MSVHGEDASCILHHEYNSHTYRITFPSHLCADDAWQRSLGRLPELKQDATQRLACYYDFIDTHKSAFNNAVKQAHAPPPLADTEKHKYHSTQRVKMELRGTGLLASAHKDATARAIKTKRQRERRAIRRQTLHAVARVEKDVKQIVVATGIVGSNNRLLELESVNRHVARLHKVQMPRSSSRSFCQSSTPEVSVSVGKEYKAPIAESVSRAVAFRSCIGGQMFDSNRAITVTRINPRHTLKEFEAEMHRFGERSGIYAIQCDLQVGVGVLCEAVHGAREHMGDELAIDTTHPLRMSVAKVGFSSQHIRDEAFTQLQKYIQENNLLWRVFAPYVREMHEVIWLDVEKLLNTALNHAAAKTFSVVGKKRKKHDVALCWKEGFPVITNYVLHMCLWIDGWQQHTYLKFRLLDLQGYIIPERVSEIFTVMGYIGKEATLSDYIAKAIHQIDKALQVRYTCDIISKKAWDEYRMQLSMDVSDQHQQKPCRFEVSVRLFSLVCDHLAMSRSNSAVGGSSEYRNYHSASHAFAFGQVLYQSMPEYTVGEFTQRWRKRSDLERKNKEDMEAQRATQAMCDLRIQFHESFYGKLLAEPLLAAGGDIFSAVVNIPPSFHNLFSMNMIVLKICIEYVIPKNHPVCREMINYFGEMVNSNDKGVVACSAARIRRIMTHLCRTAFEYFDTMHVQDAYVAGFRSLLLLQQALQRHYYDLRGLSATKRIAHRVCSALLLTEIYAAEWFFRGQHERKVGKNGQPIRFKPSTQTLYAVDVACNTVEFEQLFLADNNPLALHLEESFEQSLVHPRDATADSRNELDLMNSINREFGRLWLRNEVPMHRSSPSGWSKFVDLPCHYTHLHICRCLFGLNDVTHFNLMRVLTRISTLCDVRDCIWFDKSGIVIQRMELSDVPDSMKNNWVDLRQLQLFTSGSALSRNNNTRNHFYTSFILSGETREDVKEDMRDDDRYAGRRGGKESEFLFTLLRSDKRWMSIRQQFMSRGVAEMQALRARRQKNTKASCVRVESVCHCGDDLRAKYDTKTGQLIPRVIPLWYLQWYKIEGRSCVRPVWFTDVVIIHWVAIKRVRSIVVRDRLLAFLPALNVQRANKYLSFLEVRMSLVKTDAEKEDICERIKKWTKVKEANEQSERKRKRTPPTLSQKEELQRQSQIRKRKSAYIKKLSALTTDFVHKFEGDSNAIPAITTARALTSGNIVDHNHSNARVKVTIKSGECLYLLTRIEGILSRIRHLDYLLSSAWLPPWLNYESGHCYSNQRAVQQSIGNGIPGACSCAGKCVRNTCPCRREQRHCSDECHKNSVTCKNYDIEENGE
jgi:hypothetical protein